MKRSREFTCVSLSSLSEAVLCVRASGSYILIHYKNNGIIAIQILWNIKNDYNILIWEEFSEKKHLISSLLQTMFYIFFTLVDFFLILSIILLFICIYIWYNINDNIYVNIYAFMYICYIRILFASWLKLHKKRRRRLYVCACIAWKKNADNDTYISAPNSVYNWLGEL